MTAKSLNVANTLLKLRGAIRSKRFVVVHVRAGLIMLGVTALSHPWESDRPCQITGDSRRLIAAVARISPQRT
jgi:hypothetical protein